MLEQVRLGLALVWHFRPNKFQTNTMFVFDMLNILNTLARV